ncbi:MAG: hypothetical protein KDB28_06555 [Tetrasphaera sp.]|nr:hypothetical protein [Tetrasphaera sp.]
MSGWWRDNRAWLAALPVAAAVGAGASAYQVRTFWWESGMHRQVAAPAPGEPAGLTERYRDGQGETSRTLSVRLLGIDPAPADAAAADPAPPDPTPPDPAPPDPGPAGGAPGAAAYRVRLEFSARPDQELRPCRIAVLGADGSRYEAEPGLSPCLPEDHPGPSASVIEGDPRGHVEPGEERPATWQVAPVIQTAAAARIVAVRVWFGYPEYVELRAEP